MLFANNTQVETKTDLPRKTENLISIMDDVENAKYSGDTALKRSRV